MPSNPFKINPERKRTAAGGRLSLAAVRYLGRTVASPRGLSPGGRADARDLQLRLFRAQLSRPADGVRAGGGA